MQVKQQSRLYESAAAYVEDQPAFLNMAVLAATHLQPLPLLHTLKGIEVPCTPLHSVLRFPLD